MRVGDTGLCAQSVSDGGEDKVGVVVRCVTHRGQESACSGQREDCGAVGETNTRVTSHITFVFSVIVGHVERSRQSLTSGLPVEPRGRHLFVLLIVQYDSAAGSK